MENTINYITNGVGFTALLAAVIEQARHDATHSKNEADRKDALLGIEEWRQEVEADLNFKLYE